ncbi:MAG: hypothetical protein HZA54_14860 [Planctomycetes bacterium]|nr:hypothetical protein [Planctomycetota bacterium]
MSLDVKLPDSLLPFVEEAMEELGLADRDQCIAELLRRLAARRGRVLTLRVAAQGDFRLRRLTDQDYRAYQRRSIGIGPSLPLDLFSPITFRIAEVYAVLKDRFGPSAEYYDDYKCSFDFPFALSLPGPTDEPAYLLRIGDYRGGLELQLEKIVAPDDPRLRESIYYPPQPDFPRERLHEFLDSLTGFLAGSFEELKPRWREEFVLAVASQSLLTGFDGKRFFKRHFEDEGEYAAALVKLSHLRTRAPSAPEFP